MAGLGGIEPPRPLSKSGALPLCNRPKCTNRLNGAAREIRTLKGISSILDYKSRPLAIRVTAAYNITYSKTCSPGTARTYSAYAGS